MNGSTAAVALFHNLSLYIANIGDSEALLIKKTYVISATGVRVQHPYSATNTHL